MEALIQQAKALASQATDAERIQMIDSLTDLAISLETSWDSAQRIMYTHYQIAGAQMANDLKLFELIASNKEPITVEQLAQKTGADPIFLGRFLRYLASVRMIKETAKNTFTANNVTEAMKNPGNQAGVGHYFESMGPILQCTPSFFAENGYKNPNDNVKAPFGKAFKTDLPAFLYLQTQPKLVKYFGDFMVGQRGETPGWLSVYPIEEETKDWDPEKPVFVDIGGGFGHQCKDLKTKYPDLPGKVILQDLPHQIDNAVAPAKDVELMVHDFFAPQPVKGAKYYYMRNIIHDWPDEKCRLILESIKSAMGPDSVILLDDMVLPEKGVHWHATQIDMTMMVGLASMERTEEQWHAMLKSAGLKAKKIYTYTESLRDSIIVAVPE